MLVPFLCILLVLSLWFFTSEFTDDTGKELIPLINEVCDAAASGDWERASDTYGNFFALWKEHREIYELYTDSAKMLRLDQSVLRCSEYIAARERGLTCGEIAGIILYLDDMSTENRFQIRSIL